MSRENQSLNESSIDNTDDRKRYEYQSKYDDCARGEIRYESIFLIIIILSSFFMIYLNWIGLLSNLCNITADQNETFRRYIFYTASGLLGGSTFSIKYFYRVVARGWWHQDRRIWRVSTPLLSSVIGFMTGVLIEAQLINTTIPSSAPSIIAIGFLAGYFADEAVGKMYEIANVIFGSNNTKKG
ncbi:hypothetical protein ACN9J3_08060 [Aliarcobacter butzleri]|uniref:hypothetical protein n=1 Tax=Aliarcobacter butzleri TaxID=28197 RepID=UPI003B20BA1B